MGTERLKPLHNFTMPGGLRWGNQRQLRCMKVDSDDDLPTVHRFSAATDANHSVDHHHHHRRTSRQRNPSSEFLNRSDKLRRTPPLAAEADGGIAAMREKVMFDLQTAAHKMKDAIFKDGLVERQLESGDGEPQRPWNLRTRRAAVQNSGSGAAAACDGGNGGDWKGLSLDVPKPISGIPQIRATSAEKSPMLRHGGDCGGSGGATPSGEKRERAKFSVALSKKEIEEDFMVFGQRLPRRPKKRPRIVQKQLDTLFPGLWLTEVTPDMYKVPEAAP